MQVKKRFLVLSLIFAQLMGVLILTGCVRSGQSESEVLGKERPNVLFIAVDDLNTCLGCLNDYAHTKDAPKQNLPKQNARWNTYSTYNFQPYFVEQKARPSQSGANKSSVDP